jgi:hypothetical protein
MLKRRKKTGFRYVKTYGYGTRMTKKEVEEHNKNKKVWGKPKPKKIKRKIAIKREYKPTGNPKGRPSYAVLEQRMQTRRQELLRQIKDFETTYGISVITGVKRHNLV